MITTLNFADAKIHWATVLNNNNVPFPFSTYEWHALWYEVYGKEYEPMVLLVDNHILAPLAKKDDIVIFSGGDEIADYLDILGSNEYKVQAWQEIIMYLKNNGVTKLALRNVPQSSATLQYFKESSEKEDTTPIATLPDSWEAYLTGLDRKHRHELKRKINKFEREQTEIEITQSQYPQKDIELLISLMKLNPNKKEFFTPENEEFFRKLPLVFQDSLEIQLLKVGGKLTSAIAGFNSKSTYYLYNSGFDEINFPGSGFYLKAIHIKDSIEKGIKEYNFLQGSERYKYELGGKDFEVYKVEKTI